MLAQSVQQAGASADDEPVPLPVHPQRDPEGSPVNRGRTGDAPSRFSACRSDSAICATGYRDRTVSAVRAPVGAFPASGIDLALRRNTSRRAAMKAAAAVGDGIRGKAP